MRHQPTEEQRAAAKARREKFRTFTKQIAAMTDGQRAALAEKFLTVTTCEGRSLSLHNTCLIAFQATAPVTLVGGFQQWKNQGRTVRKGEHGFAIWIPLKHEKDPRTDAGDEAQESDDRPGFILGTVFDISQTEPLEAAAKQAA